jgi:hypothetical protein
VSREGTMVIELAIDFGLISKKYDKKALTLLFWPYLLITGTVCKPLDSNKQVRFRLFLQEAIQTTLFRWSNLFTNYQLLKFRLCLFRFSLLLLSF